MAKLDWNRAAAENRVRICGSDTLAASDATLRSGRLPRMPLRTKGVLSQVEALRRQAELVEQIRRGKLRREEKVERGAELNRGKRVRATRLEARKTAAFARVASSGLEDAARQRSALEAAARMEGVVVERLAPGSTSRNRRQAAADG